MGKWVMAEGQVYEEFNHELHVCPRFVPPKNWPHYWCFDFGYVDPFVWLDLVEDPDTGIVYLYRELYHTEMRVEDACNIIKQSTYGEAPPMALICDHDAENRATLEKEFGYLTLPAFKLIHPGIQGVKTRLQMSKRRSNSSNPDGRPGLYIMENAGIRIDPKLKARYKPHSTLDEVDCYVWDTGKMSLDKYKDMPVDKDNHGMDALRYGIAFIDNLATDPQQFEKVVHYNDVGLDEEMGHYLDTMISWY
jgi:phage terminase large subunit